MLMRVYISGGITGVENYKQFFDEAEKTLKSEGHEVINPTSFDSVLPQLTYEEFMKFDIFLLDMCDAIYMLKGWQKSCGANREYGYALASDKLIIEE
jgi:nucleoside 2-deoxyribosyltransferase